MENAVRVFAGFTFQQQFSRHAEVYGERALIESDENEFSAARYRFDAAPGEALGQLGTIPGSHETRGEAGTHDAAAGQVRSDRANDGFNFWQFRH
jgi:hypothetical protein